MPAQPIGIYAEQIAKREALVAHMSPAARHANFPKVYARPPVADDAASAAKRKAAELQAENTRLKVNIARLEVRIESLESIQARLLMESARRKLTVRDALPVGSIDRIVSVVCKHWQADPAVVKAVGRTRGVVRPRQACYRLLTDLLRMSRPNVGRVFNRDHTTVMHGLYSADILLSTDADWRRRFEAALAELKSGAEQ